MPVNTRLRLSVTTGLPAVGTVGSAHSCEPLRPSGKRSDCDPTIGPCLKSDGVLRAPGRRLPELVTGTCVPRTD